MSARLLKLLCVCCLAVVVAPVPHAQALAHPIAADREQVVVIRAGRIVTGTGETIENGMIVIVDGEITGVGRSVEHPRTARIIDARDQVVMPGLIHARTRHGLPNYGRTGQRANLKAADDIYAELIDFDELLRNGFTTAVFVPPGSGIPGRATVQRTGGPEAHRVLEETGYLRITMTAAGRDKATLRSALQAAQREIDKVETARKEWEKKQEEAAKEKPAEAPKEGTGGARADDDKREPEKKPDAPKEFTPPAIPAALRPIVDLIRREPGAVALIELGNASGLLHTEEVIGRYENLPVMFFLQSTVGDFHNVVGRLGERGALVLTGPDLTRIPNTVIRYNTVAELFRAGAEVAVIPSGSLDTMRSQLAELVRSGLPREDALRAITVNTARVAGVEDRLGTIEAGKHADLIFLDSDPLDGLSRVTRTMIRGETVWSSGD